MTVQFAAIVLVLGLCTKPAAAMQEKNENVPDSNTLRAAFKNGRTEGHFRYFLMATDNKKGLSDY